MIHVSGAGSEKGKRNPMVSLGGSLHVPDQRRQFQLLFCVTGCSVMNANAQDNKILLVILSQCFTSFILGCFMFYVANSERPRPTWATDASSHRLLASEPAC